MRGLRRFDHPEGWELIRRRAINEEHTPVELLAYNDDPATRDLLLRLLTETTDGFLLDTALNSARRLWGQDSLEPDYAALRNVKAKDGFDWDELFRRLQEKGDARPMLEILPRLDEEAAGRVKAILLSRQPLPVAEAETVVAAPDALAAASRPTCSAGPRPRGRGQRWRRRWGAGGGNGTANARKRSAAA